MKAVEREIGEATCRLEDVTLEEVVKEEIDLSCETEKKIKEQLSNTSLSEQEDATATALSRTNRFSHEKKMVGLDDDKRQVATLLTRYSKQLELVSIIGMAGIGKTSLAEEVYADPMAKHLSKAETTVECWNKVADTEYSLIIDADEDLSKELVSNNIVLVHERSPAGGIKTCSVHSAFWHLCIREAKKKKFFHVINSYANGVTGGVEGQQRLCIHNNVLFGIKNVYESMESTSNIRSLLCTGPHHQYPVPTCLSFSLLRILEALTIRFYKFPNEVLKLVKLKYLAFTYNGELPASISKLWELQYLIVHKYLSIISSRARRPYLPMEIWDMQELRHLEVMGSDLPDPNSEGAHLPNLLTLSGISAHSCTKKVLGRIPNLKKLGIQTELALDAAETSCCLDHLSRLYRLESLKCVIVNPNTSSQVVPVAPPALSVSWSSLKRLTLRGLGFPWEYMSGIAQLPNLEVLKLHCYAFQGPEWVVGDFRQLKYLLLEDIDLERWDSSDDCFPLLQRLTIQHCYKLKELPSEIGEIPTLKMIELVDCNDTLVALGKQLLSEQEKHGNVFQVCIKSSQDDRKLKS
ncbi:UNVERIFIED_CONTAM: putative late blight resistance proteinR1B-16 [Sesamum radiatum]|uniref:Late blight resistance proteinR1B-16 n=1 Tax=Sesamum radiatum TaxID=300843 RepID=A0AAW2KTR7_SESRA